ncbi:hypothetical protein T459_33114 [Capsicum annuum]|uniref:Uncharacterized protein n=1 Tax=Capsicum annuum TaxID=4072 RepID=A0A2G2XZU0_CAPAN|nr:hypothetical protein T459_33114 [Capsicum annuum]
MKDGDKGRRIFMIFGKISIHSLCSQSSIPKKRETCQKSPVGFVYPTKKGTGLLGMVTKHLVSVSFSFDFANSGLLLTYDIILPTHRCKRYSTVLTGVLWCNRGAGTKERLYPASFPLIRQLSRAH